MNSLVKNPAQWIRGLAILVGAVLLFRQGIWIREFYKRDNPLLAMQGERMGWEPLVHLVPSRNCEKNQCPAGIWPNQSARLHPYLENFQDPTPHSGWREDRETPFRYLRFDGVNDRIRIPNANLSTRTGYSALALVRSTEQNTDSQIFDSRYGNFQSPLRMSYRHGRFSCEMEVPNGSAIIAIPYGGFPLEAGKWTSVGCVWNPFVSVFSAFAEGRLVGETRVSIEVPLTSDKLTLGGSLTSSQMEYFKGDIGFFRLSTHPTSADLFSEEMLEERKRLALDKPRKRPVRNAKNLRNSSTKS